MAEERLDGSVVELGVGGVDWREVKNKPLAIITGNGLRHPLLCLSATHPLLSVCLSHCCYLSCPSDLFPFLCLLSFLFLSISSSSLISLPISFSLHFSLQLLSVFATLSPPCGSCSLLPSRSHDLRFLLSTSLCTCLFKSSSPCISFLTLFIPYSLIRSVSISPMLFLSRSAPSTVPEQVENKLISLSLTLSHQQPSFAF